MVIWSDWLTVAGTALGMTDAQAGTFLSLAMTISIILAILIATRGKRSQYTVSIGALLCMVLFSFMGWMPVWTGSVIGLVLALFIASLFRGGF